MVFQRIAPTRIVHFLLLLLYLLMHFQGESALAQNSQQDNNAVNQYNPRSSKFSTEVTRNASTSTTGIAQDYSLKIIAKTGQSLDGSKTLISLGVGPSINNFGKIAFTALEESEMSRRIFLVRGGEYFKNYFAPANLPGHLLQVNDSDEIAYWAQFHIDPNLNTFILRLDSNDGGPTIAVGNPWPQWDTPFLYVNPYITLSNKGRVLFVGDLRGSIPLTVLASRTSGSDAFEMSSKKLTGLPVMYPMLSDNDRTIVRGGGNETAPIVVFLDKTLDEQNAVGLAETPEFVRIGQKPGISDDGHTFAYMAEHSTLGLGVFFGVLDNNPIPIWLFETVNGSTPNLDFRTAVNRSNIASDEKYTIVYMNRNTNDILGIYATEVDISDFSNVKFSTPFRIAQVGQTITGLAGALQNLNIYDPVNVFGDIVFWAETESGNQAIVRASKTMACFSYQPLEPAVNTDVVFDGSCSVGEISDNNYFWDFGDNSLGNGRIVTHTYNEIGEYKVTLTVFDNAGNSHSSSQDVLVQRGLSILNEMTDKELYNLEDAVEISCEVRDDLGEKIYAQVLARITTPDGNMHVIPLEPRRDPFTPQIAGPPPDWYENSFLFTNTDGSYQIEIEARRSGYAPDKVELEFRIDVKPVAVISCPTKSLDAETELIFNGSESYDPGGGEIVHYEWEVNGETKEGQEVKFTFSSPGLHQVKLTVEDDEGQKVFLEKNIPILIVGNRIGFLCIERAKEFSNQVWRLGQITETWAATYFAATEFIGGFLTVARLTHGAVRGILFEDWTEIDPNAIIIQFGASEISDDLFMLDHQNRLELIRSYRAIADDPPDSNYTEIVEIEPYVPFQASPEFNWEARIIDYTNHTGNNRVIAKALLTALERFQGASRENADEYLFLQANSARQFSNMMVESFDSLDIVSSNLIAETELIESTTSISNKFEVLQQRLMVDGFFEDEKDSLKSKGATDSDIEAYQKQLIEFDVDQLIDDYQQVQNQFVQGKSVYTDLTIQLSEIISSLEDSLDLGNKGDVNSDGKIDSSDVFLIVDIFLGKISPTASQWWTADFNNDFTINVLDVQAAINAFSSGAKVGVTKRSDSQGDTLRVLNGGGSLGSQGNDVSIYLANSTEVAALSFDLTDTPDWLTSTGSHTLPQTNGFKIGINETGRVILYNLTGTTISSGKRTILDILFDVSSEADVSIVTLKLKNVILSDPSAIAIRNVLLVDGEFAIESPVSIETNQHIPKEYFLDQNYPNPFNPETTIRYYLPRGGNIRLEIYNIRGQLVKTLVDKHELAGSYSVKWLGEDNMGRKVGNGVYIYKITADDFIQTRKMILVK